MLKSVALAGVIALGLMALPAQAAVTIFEGATPSALTLNGPLEKLPDLSRIASSSNKAEVDRPRMVAGSGNAKPFELPEPATWGMLLAGLGTIGYTMRRQGKMNASFA